MDKNVNQQLSSFIDNELNCEKALALLKELQSQPELQNKMNRYQWVSCILSSEDFVPIKANFLASVQQGIMTEPLYFLKPKLPVKNPYKTWVVALAACVALIAVLVSKAVDNRPLKPNSLSTSTIATAKQAQTSKNMHSQKTTSQLFLKPKPNKSETMRFNDYLRVHNTSLYTNGTVIFLPYTQTASYKQD